MCEFCHTHGEGKKWYLQAKNYSDDLLSDVRRRKFIEDFLSKPERLAKDVEALKQLDKAPRFVRNVIGRIATRRSKKVHFGQVAPIEEIEQIFGFVGSVVRTSCICRHATLGKEKRYCYGVSMDPNGGEFRKIVQGLDQSFMTGPDTGGVERLSKEEAIAAFREHEHEGLCHTIWTFHAPFIGGICNCDRSDCLAMKATVTHNVPVMFRAEYVAEVNPDNCTGCRACMRVCQFGALTYSPSTQKSVVDQHWCYGCGICRAVCKKDAISLKDRREVPAAAGLW